MRRMHGSRLGWTFVGLLAGCTIGEADEDDDEGSGCPEYSIQTWEVELSGAEAREVWPLADDACFEVCDAGPLATGVPTCVPEPGWSPSMSTAAMRGDDDDDDDDLTIACSVEVVFDGCIGGRRSAALCSDGAIGRGSDVAQWLAAMAHEEAASVASFVRLGRRLHELRAPADLVARCRAAAIDEARHARIMRRWARAHGVEPARPRHDDAGVASLETLAIENAIEGCVHESWAALELAWIARREAGTAKGPALAGIASDELGHAELAWAIDEWLRTQLEADACARVDAARTKAMHGLVARVQARGDRARFGAAPRGIATRLARGLAATISRS